MPLRLLLSFAAPHRRRLSAVLLLLLLDAALSLAVPALAGIAAQHVFHGGGGSGRIVAFILALLALMALARYASNHAGANASAQVIADLRMRLYDHLQALPLAFHHERRHGDVLALVTYEAAQLAGFLSGTLLSLLPSLLMVFGAVVLMLRIDLLLGTAVALLVPVFYLVVKLFGRRLRHLGVRLQEADAAAVALATENLTMVPAIKAFTREAPESQRYADRLEAIRQLNASQARAFAAMEPAFQFIATGVAVLVLWAAAERAGSGAMGAAGFVSFILYGALLTRPVGRIAAAYGQALMARGTLDRLQRVLAEPPEPLHAALRDLPPVRGAIDIEALRFAYAGRPAVFDGLNLHVAAGEIVALTGRNGSGKSTLAALLLRLHEPQGGRILLDGLDIREVSLHSLRRSIAVVPQHVLLLNASVAENIAFGRTGASREEVIQAARRAHAHEFITALPEGYETVVGDQGVRLSGGQRQRIALARALLKDAPILVLDEPTAMFDPQAEEAFVRTMREELGDRTTLLITHRPASLQLADRVVDLDAIKP